MGIRIFDYADEFRIEIAGRFCGAAVADAEASWKRALTHNISRVIRVDIAELSGYDDAGCQLLRTMQRHGTHLVAGTAQSLIFLNEITGPPRSLWGPSLVKGSGKRAGKADARPIRAFAAGE